MKTLKPEEVREMLVLLEQRITRMRQGIERAQSQIKHIQEKRCRHRRKEHGIGIFLPFHCLDCHSYVDENNKTILRDKVDDYLEDMK